jgi:hypothetical protein
MNGERIDLVCHIGGDSDLVQAWLDHYTALGVSRFHLVVHGSAERNARLHQLADSYPVAVSQTDEGEFRSEEKARRLNAVLAGLRGRWVVCADSDELLELPYSSLERTVQVLRRLRATALYAPVLQRLRADGSLDTPDPVRDPHRELPLCSRDLARAMGVDASGSKFPATSRISRSTGFASRPGTRFRTSARSSSGGGSCGPRAPAPMPSRSCRDRCRTRSASLPRPRHRAPDARAAACASTSTTPRSAASGAPTSATCAAP